MLNGIILQTIYYVLCYIKINRKNIEVKQPEKVEVKQEEKKEEVKEEPQPEVKEETTIDPEII